MSLHFSSATFKATPNPGGLFLFRKPILKREDFHTPTWRRFATFIEARIDELRKLNDSPSLSPERTALIRGGISELQKILALADEVSASPAVSPEELIGADEANGR